MKRWMAITAVGLTLWAAGWADTVFQRDGGILRGKVSFTTNRLVRVVSSTATNTIPHTNLLRALIAPAATRGGLSGVTFRLFEGDWKTLPDLSNLQPDRSGVLLASRVDLSPLGTQGGAKRVFDLTPDQVLNRWESPAIAGRPFAIHATVQPTAADGVILAHGGYMDGYVLYLDKGHLVLSIISNRKHAQVRSEKPLTLNQPAAVTARVFEDGNLVLRVNGQPAGQAIATELLMRMPFDGLSVGRDTGLPMDKNKGENPFKGTLKDVRVVLGGAALVFTGNLQITTAGPHQFHLDSDAATRLEIDGRVIIDNTDLTKPPKPWGTADLVTGPHQFRLTYAQLLPPQPVPGKAAPPTVLNTIDKPWIEDKLPAGVVFTQGKFEFVTAPAPVYSGARSLKLSSPKKLSAYFNSDRQINRNIEPLILAEGDRFYAYVYLDPQDPPEAVEMAWHDRRGWEHRAYWGQNLFDGKDGRHNTQRLWPMGPLPPVGKWARLEVPALAVGYAPNSPWPSVHGWGFQVAGGTAYFDQAGVASPITVPAANTRHLRLEWFGPGITDHALSAVADPRTPTWRPDDLAVTKAGLLTIDGSYFPQPVKKIDDETVQFGNTTLDRTFASALFLRPLTVTEARGLRGKPHGALLQDGSFLEGKPVALDAKTVTINSVLHGLKTYKLNEEAVALVFKPAAKPAFRHRFRLRDGSILFANRFDVKGSQITLIAPPLTDRALPISQIAEITSGTLHDPLQQAERHWRAHSEAGRQFLQTRDTANRAVMQRHRNLVIEHIATTNEIAEVKKTLPPLIQAETDAMAALTKATTNRTALLARVNTSNSAHVAARTAHTTARTKLDSECLKSDQASQALLRHLTTIQRPGHQSFAVVQNRTLALAAAQLFTQQETAAIEAARHQATTAHLAAQAAAAAADKAVTAAKAKLTPALAVRTTAQTDLAAKQKTTLAARAALITAQTNQLRATLDQQANAHHNHLQALRQQSRLDLRAHQLTAHIQRATTNAAAKTAASKTAATALTTAATQTNTAVQALTTAKTAATTAATAANKAKTDLATLQNTQLNPAIAKAAAAAEAVAAAIKAKPLAAQKLEDTKNIAAQALKAATDASKIAQTPFSPDQLKKDRTSLQLLAAELQKLTAAAQAPIDILQKEKLIPATNAAKAATNALTKATAEKAAADLALATLKTNITTATTAHQAADKIALAAEAKAKTAATAATTATNTLKTAQAAVATLQTATATAQEAMADKHLARPPAAHAEGLAQAALYHARTNRLQATRTLNQAKAALTAATAANTSAQAAATATGNLANAAQTRAKTAATTLTTANSLTTTKRTALNTTRTALDTLLAKQPPATTLATTTAHNLAAAQSTHRVATNRTAILTTKVTTATADLKSAEDAAKANQNPDQTEPLRAQVTASKAKLAILTTAQTQAKAKATATKQVMTQALSARDTAAKAVTALNTQIATATLAWRKAEAEFTAARAANQAAAATAQQTTLDARQAAALAASRKALATEAADVLKTATSFNTEATAKDKATTTALTTATTARATAAKALVTATQQATAATQAHRAALKAQTEAETIAATAQAKLDEAAQAHVDAVRLAKAERVKADQAKQALDLLAIDRQEEAKAKVAAAAMAITEAQSAKTAAEQAQRNASTAIATYTPTLDAAKDAGTKVMTLMTTAMGDPVMAAKLDADKKAMAVALKKFADSYVAVHQKRTKDAVTAANTALTQAQTAKTTADKAANTIKVKAADATTALQKANQAQNDAEAAVKKAEMALAQSIENHAQADADAKDKAQQDEAAKAELAAHVAEQKLVIAEQAKVKTTLTAALAENTKQTQANQAAAKSVTTLELALATANQTEAEAQVKASAAQLTVAREADQVAILESQAAAWKERAARLQGQLSQLSALRQSPTQAMVTSLDSAATTALNAKSSSEKTLLTNLAKAITQEQAWRAAVQVAGDADDEELKAQQAEADAWTELIAVRAAADLAQTTFEQAQQEHRVRKAAADTVRAKLATLEKTAAAAQEQLKALQPAYEAIVRPK